MRIRWAAESNEHVAKVTARHESIELALKMR